MLDIIYMTFQVILLIVYAIVIKCNYCVFKIMILYIKKVDLSENNQKY